MNTLLKHLYAFVSALADLVFPHLCYACAQKNIYKKDLFCVRCQHHLPESDQHLQQDNIFTRRFWGLIPIVGGAALYLYRKGGLVQHIIHQFKYQGKKEIGLRLGEYYGSKLLHSTHFQTIDAIVPVPLHKTKQRWRGYNQSEQFAYGLSNSMNKPAVNLLIRVKNTATQTKKDVLDRHENVEKIFQFAPNRMVPPGAHILLVDDVLTTGATLEACAKVLIAQHYKVSMATVAIAI